MYRICFVAALAAGLLHAQTVSIAPTGYITVMPGGTQQFTANGSVIWSAGGKIGGNSTVGTINSTGLYTAPKVSAASGQVQITAVVAGDSSVSATTYIYMVAAGPPISSVSPNPIPIGTDTITITGTAGERGLRS
jgi:hypothetical protein